jgi:hypothetical protein
LRMVENLETARSGQASATNNGLVLLSPSH